MNTLSALSHLSASRCDAFTMTWEEIADSTDKIAIVPVGSLEQHGPHLPLGTDTIIGMGIANTVAAGLEQLATSSPELGIAGAVVLPPIDYGYRSNPFSGGGPLFPGTVDLSATTVIALFEDVLGELIADGFHKILIVNSHFENQFPIQEAMIKVDAATGHQAVMVQTNWWDPLPESVIKEVFSEDIFPGWALEHGAVTETSLMLHLAPNLVRTDRIPLLAPFTPPTHIRVPNRASDIPPEGSLANAATATAAKGEIITRATTDGILAICLDEFGAAPTPASAATDAAPQMHVPAGA